MILGVQGKPRAPFPDVVIGRITTAGVAADERRDHTLLLLDGASGNDIEGYAALLCLPEAQFDRTTTPIVEASPLDHLTEGDVVSLDPRGYVRTLYRRNSHHNSLFATDHCNSLCLMCSQPPRDVDERGIIDRHLRLIRLIDPATAELGITGGEPTLLKEGLIRVIQECRDRLPATALHILSNGRLFCYANFAKAVAEIRHPDLMIGIPLYSDIDAEHDYVVQCRGAFDETVRGIQNLGQYGVPTEIRVVIHRMTYERLPQLAEFIYRNLTFASHMALMGLEMTGFTVPNAELLWIDPADYQDQLEQATLFLVDRGMRVSIYNHQLCTIPPSLWRFSRRSISDWKNDFLPVCSECEVKDACGGFFASTLQRHRISARIAPIRTVVDGAGALHPRTGVEA